jgi:hypothetical protein
MVAEAVRLTAPIDQPATVRLAMTAVQSVHSSSALASVRPATAPSVPDATTAHLVPAGAAMSAQLAMHARLVTTAVAHVHSATTARVQTAHAPTAQKVVANGLRAKTAVPALTVTTAQVQTVLAAIVRPKVVANGLRAKTAVPVRSAMTVQPTVLAASVQTALPMAAATGLHAKSQPVSAAMLHAMTAVLVRSAMIARLAVTLTTHVAQTAPTA